MKVPARKHSKKVPEQNANPKGPIATAFEKILFLEDPTIFLDFSEEAFCFDEPN